MAIALLLGGFNRVIRALFGQPTAKAA
jgi:hypothetical protein